VTSIVLRAYEVIEYKKANFGCWPIGKESNTAPDWGRLLRCSGHRRGACRAASLVRLALVVSAEFGGCGERCRPSVDSCGGPGVLVLGASAVLRICAHQSSVTGRLLWQRGSKDRK
jgi:hypothetical protein